MKKIFLLFIAFSFYNSTSFSQSTIHGKITNKENKPLSGATVTVSKVNEEIIIAYVISSNDGRFLLNIDSTLDSLQINVSYLGYAEQTKVTTNKNQTLNFTLPESSETLKEVFIKTFPIVKRGDTINYSVNTFKDQKDRVIADVLAKMPGIEVLSDGKILYQGKPISKYYIEGLDLLEGKYNLANNNLPVDAVSKVQILENHQPVKLLDGLVFSDRAALNIKLKKNIALTGTAKLGAGLSPFLWDANLTPMLFTKKQQMITSYQSNNVGNDISKEIKTLTLEDLIDQLKSNNEKVDWVGIQQISSPSFSEKRWLDNNAHLFTTNYLVRIKKDFDLKVNLSYINDFQQQKGSTQTTFFTPTDTINIIENTENKLFFNSLKGKFILTKNTKKNYFKNTFEVSKYWDSKNGYILSNVEKIDQKVINLFASFSNKLKWIKPLGGKLTTIKSVVTYTHSPQNLTITPGQFEDIFNNGNSFDKIDQSIDYSNFYSNNSLSFIKGFKAVTFTPKIGFTQQNQQLSSRITLFENGNTNTLSASFKNNLNFNNSSIYTILKTQYRYKNWKLELETPFKIQTFNRVDNAVNKSQKLNRFTFEPRLSIRKDINTFWKTTFSASLKNGFGNINQLYYGYILNNYRNIQQYNTPILESFRKNIAFSFSYRNPIKSIFINVFYSYNNTSQNLLFGNNINSDGTSSYGYFEQDNNSNTHNINLRGSKYFSKLKTTLTIAANTLQNKKQQLLNGTLTNVTTRGFQVNGKLNAEITEWLSINFKSKFSISNTQFETQSFSSIVTQEQLLNFNFYPTSNQYIGFDSEYSKNNFSDENQENYFLNLNYRYTLKKRRIDLELNWNNILNTKQFTSAFSNSFTYMQSTYLLRPSQILLSVKFSF